MFFYNEDSNGSNPNDPNDPNNPGTPSDPTTPIVGWSRTTIYDPNITTNISFGESVDATSDGNYVVVGAPSHRVSGKLHQGRAYVFERGQNDSWDTHFELVPSDRNPNGFDYFGKKVAVSADGNIVVIGAKKTFESPDGAIYVFEKTGTLQWTEIAKLKIPAGQHSATTSDNNVGFAENGISVSSDGNIIAVGAPSNFAGGRVHTWYRTGTGQSYTHINVSSIEGGDRGKSLQISPDGTRLIVGLPMADGNGSMGVYSNVDDSITHAGLIDLFTWNPTTSQWDGFDDGDYNFWEYDPEQNMNNYYGTSVAASSISLVASAVGADATNANETGKVVVQDMPEVGEQPIIGSTNEKILTLPEEYAFENDFFGHVVDVSQDGNSVFVSAYGKSSPSMSSFGAVYAFQKNSTTGEWDNIGAFLSDNPTANKQFGNAMRASRDGLVVAVGEKLNSIQTSNAGAVHIFLKD